MGKTSIIDELATMGYKCVPEAGRQIIREQVAIGGNKLPWKNRMSYALAMLSKSHLDYQEHLVHKTAVFFDRGLPDILGYLDLCGLPIPNELLIIIKSAPYYKRVYITPPWEEIFHQDKERRQSFNEATRTYGMMKKTYQYLSYQPVDIPRMSVSQRAQFILNDLDENDKRINA